MHQTRENLDIIFRKTAPEKVLRLLKDSWRMEKGDVTDYVNHYPEEAYQHIAFGILLEYSEDEIDIRYREIEENFQDQSNAGIFSLLYLYADEVLTKRDGVLACKLEKVLDWNSISKRLGQDLFTIAWLAKKDCEWMEQEKKHHFTWPAVLPTDDVRLNSLLKKGTAENHFHLHGSTQSFALSWASLMNHPDQIKSFFKYKDQFKTDREMHISRGIEDNVEPWDERIRYAAMIRALLFERLMDVNGDLDKQYVETQFTKFSRFAMTDDVKRIVERLRRNYGVAFAQPDHTARCLDYAISLQAYDVKEDNSNRLLAGERAFLYKCFVKIYQQEDKSENSALSTYEKTLFYLYLLIKNNFRSDMIQVNHKTGFYNFSKYQDRKEQFFGKYKEYYVEAQRLAVVAARQENHIRSFENRIMVQKSQFGLKKYIDQLDKYIRFPNQREQNYNYYVLHFPKKQFCEKEFSEKPYLYMCPRNVKTRNSAEVCARALRKYLMSEQGREQRVLGIDACSNEIGCRPETFATEFRYIRKVSELRYEIPWYRTPIEKYEEMGVTYHAGEDFLNIVDGIRAIDEAMVFLELRKSDRLGHAIALGILPEDYYKKKRMIIYQPKQDYLDDLVWLLYRSLEWNVVIEADHREEMRRKARELFNELYEDKLSEIAKWRCGDILDIYYASWKLRGDHPRLYVTGSYQEINKFRLDPYEQFMTREKNQGELQHLRNDELTTLLYYWYHYDRGVKRRALQSEHFVVEKWYIQLVEEMQKALRKRIAEKGIGIECNPTSNVLISNFMYYSEHPVLVFNHYHLDSRTEEPNLWVSINTDDIGVFDTSLSNEYALLFSALARQRHEENNWDDNVIYEYLDALRQNGLDMAFKDYDPAIDRKELGEETNKVPGKHWWN